MLANSARMFGRLKRKDNDTMDKPDFSELTGNIESLHSQLSNIYNEMTETMAAWQRKLGVIYREVQSSLSDVENSASSLESEVDDLPDMDVDLDEVRRLAQSLVEALDM